MVLTSIDVVLRLNAVVAYVAHCCGVLLGVNLVETFQGGAPPVYTLA